ncbi:MAG: HAD family hydrolase [Elusimicrobiota bacterium]
MAQAVIFDLDGIVVDTVPIHFKAWKKMFGEYGINFTFDDYKAKVDGIPRLDGAKAVLKDLNDEEIIEAAGKKQDYFREILDSDEIPVYESTVNLIKQLKENGIPRAVISSSKNCTYILKKLGIFELMDTVVDGNRGLEGKPSPEIFLTAAGELKISPQKCLVFEDAVLGVEAAKNAGMYCVGVDRYGKPERLKEADTVIEDISQITLEKVKKFKN